MNHTDHAWALVLAAGEGSRLRSLTTTTSGIAVPKQFCSLRGGPSLLDEALQRAEAVAPRQRIYTVVAAPHRYWWKKSLWAMSQNVIVQPENRGTAIGILLPMLHIAARDPHARIVVLPSDHYVRDEATLSRALRAAAIRIASSSRNIYMLGIRPDEADPELGYIVPGPADTRGTLQVAQFVEKPPITLARTLLERGALWNAFILAGAVGAFVALFEKRYPQIVASMRRAVEQDRAEPSDAIAATELYGALPELDFSRHVLEGAEDLLRVLPVPACGWSDLGTPRRVAEALHREQSEQQSSVAARMATTYLNLAAQHARQQLAG
jgi:mannose-1-phosphate guanylyltransferase